MLEALICQLQTVHGTKAGTRGLANTGVSARGGSSVPTARQGERRREIIYTHIYTFYTPTFSDRHPNHP